MKIGILIGGLTELKVLQPIIEYLGDLKVPYHLLIRKVDSLKRQYTQASRESIALSSKKIINGALNVIELNEFDELCSIVVKYKLKKLLAVEAFRLGKLTEQISHICEVYSVSYFSDSCFRKRIDTKSIRRIYHSALHCMNTFHKFYGLKYDSNKDRLIGSPIFDCLPHNQKHQPGILLFTPNMFERDLPAVFGDEKKMTNIISKIMHQGNIVIKSRKKQFLPKKILNAYGKDIKYDSNIMYPTTSSELFKKSTVSMMFYSSTIYEAIFSDQYIVNCHINFGRWEKWERVRDYMTPLYSRVDGLIENIITDTILADKISFTNKKADKTQAKLWIERFIMPEIITDSYKRIAIDFLE